MPNCLRFRICKPRKKQGNAVEAVESEFQYFNLSEGGAKTGERRNVSSVSCQANIK